MNLRYFVVRVDADQVPIAVNAAVSCALVYAHERSASDAVFVSTIPFADICEITPAALKGTELEHALAVKMTKELGM